MNENEKLARDQRSEDYNAGYVAASRDAKEAEEKGRDYFKPHPMFPEVHLPAVSSEPQEWTPEHVASIIAARPKDSIAVSVSDAHNAALAAERKQSSALTWDMADLRKELAAERELRKLLVAALERISVGVEHQPWRLIREIADAALACIQEREKQKEQK